MEKITVYRSADGKDFSTESSCHAHEHRLCNDIIETLHLIHDICQRHDMDCSGCLFYTGAECIVTQMTGYQDDENHSPNTWNNTFSLD